MELDEEFIQDVRSIATIKQDLISNLEQYRKVKAEISSQQCDEIDFKARLHSNANIVNSNSARNYLAA